MFKAALFHAEKLLDGARSALLVPAVGMDQYQVHAGETWRSLTDDLPLGTLVHAVRHLQRTESCVGGLGSVRALPGKARIEVQIISIQLLDGTALTDHELAALGYADRASFETGLSGLLGQQRSWFIHVIPTGGSQTPQ